MSGALSFKSRIDWWVLIVLLTLVAAGLLGFAHVFTLIQRGIAGSRWLSIAVLSVLCAVGTVVPLWLLLTTRYRMSDETLDVRSGPFHRSIPIADIIDVSRSRSTRLSPALSSDRLTVDYGSGRYVIISPENKTAFLRSLEARRKDAGKSNAG